MDIKTYYESLPMSFRGVSCKVSDDKYIIVLNSEYCKEVQDKAYKHEMSHILNNDFDSDKSIDEIEIMRHKND